MNVEIAEASAARPDEAVETGDLPEQFARLTGPAFRESRRDRPMHPVAAHEHDVADFAVLHALVQFLEMPRVAGHEADANLQILRLRLIGEFKHPAAGGAVRRDRFFHEHIETLLDGVLEMHPAKRERRREDRNIAALHRIHRLLVTIEADELLVLGHIDEIAELVLQFLVTSIEPVLEDVHHGGQRHGALLGGERIARRAGAAATAANEGDLDGVAFGAMDVRQGHARERGDGGEFAGAFDEIAACGEVRLRFVHKGFVGTSSRRMRRGVNSRSLSAVGLAEAVSIEPRRDTRVPAHSVWRE